jgi:predicted glycosyltransferase
MSRILVYSHDTYGLGNIRRMLAVATHLAETLHDSSVLVVSGSPMVQGFRLTPRVDYIKLPSVSRTEREGYATRSLRLDAASVFELRANILLAAVADFRPDVMLVDKKPFGIEQELEGAIYYAHTHLPSASMALVMRDILDGPEATRRGWASTGTLDAIERFYDSVLVLGTPDIFDFSAEYGLPERVSAKVHYCGYIERPTSTRARHDVRRGLGVGSAERLVVVTPGGGQDGHRVIREYAAALPALHARGGVRSLIVCGPEMPADERREIESRVSGETGAAVLEFTDDMMAYLDAADLVVCMGGYNTLCEVATLRKPTVVVPRVRPVEEQWIRAERFSRAGLITSIHPDTLNPKRLQEAIEDGLRRGPMPATLDLGALPRVTRQVQSLLRRQRAGAHHRRAVTGSTRLAAITRTRIA